MIIISRETKFSFSANHALRIHVCGGNYLPNKGRTTILRAPPPPPHQPRETDAEREERGRETNVKLLAICSGNITARCREEKSN